MDDETRSGVLAVPETFLDGLEFYAYYTEEYDTFHLLLTPLTDLDTDVESLKYRYISSFKADSVEKAEAKLKEIERVHREHWEGGKN